ncbi:MAG: alpha/beta fold hydrolase [bacterium]|nr:alpha/beta fold hydrolase [bacterium]
MKTIRQLVCSALFKTYPATKKQEIMNEEQVSVEKILTEPDYDYEGFLNYIYDGHTYKLWYGRIGSGSAPAALVLHGGPGGSHHNLVAFQAFRDGLGLKKYHLIGHSWGTTLAVGFAAKHPDGILSISLHSPVLSFPYYINHVAPKLKQGLSCLNGKAGQIIDDYELNGVGTKSDYDEACMEFTRRHVTHTWPLPESMKKLIAARNTAVHDVMVASDSELNLPGNLKTVDVTSQLSRLDVPVLITCGSDDLCTPAFTKWQSDFANDHQYHVIQGSAHMTPVDRPLELIRIQRAFIACIELSQ